MVEVLPFWPHHLTRSPFFFFFSLTHFLCPISYWLRAFKKQERKGSLKGAWQPLATFKVAGVGRGPGGS